MPFAEGSLIIQLEELFKNKDGEALGCLQVIEPLFLKLFSNWLSKYWSGVIQRELILPRQ